MATAAPDPPRPGAADPPRPMRADARRNYERLVAAGRDAFTERGPDATLDDVARRAGVGAGTLYRHFPTREALLDAVYRQDVADLRALADKLLAEHPPDDALAAWMREQVQYVLRKRALGPFIKAVLERDHSATLARCRQMLREAAGSMLAPAQEAGTIREDVTPADVLRLGHAVGAVVETPEEADRLLGVLLDGLRPQGGQSPAAVE
jgi:AcrR family transcriptional regulator